MPSTSPALKRHNHRVHPCQTEKKQELLHLLLEKHKEKNILVVTCGTPEDIKLSNNVTVMNDDDLLKTPELLVELLISYDLPQKGIEYMARIAHAMTYALILLDQEEEKLLYPIETLLGRTIMQEPIDGFGPAIIVKKEFVKKEFTPRDEKKEYKPRSNDTRGEKKKFGDKPFRDDKPRSNKPYDKDKKDEKSGFKKPYDRDKKEDKFGAKKPWDKEKKDGKSDFKKPYDKDKKETKSDFKKPYDKNAKPDFKKPYDRDKKDSKFLGKDENGKAIFSGKSGERNHRYDGSKREDTPVLSGKKINVKVFKKPTTKE